LESPGKIYGPIELAIEGARAKADNELDRYSKIEPIIARNKNLI